VCICIIVVSIIVIHAAAAGAACTVRTAGRCHMYVCITIIGVVSVVILYNCVYYCDTCYIACAVRTAGMCHVIELHKRRLFIYIPIWMDQIWNLFAI
jgi:hypothetical protein